MGSNGMKFLGMDALAGRWRQSFFLLFFDHTPDGEWGRFKLETKRREEKERERGRERERIKWFITWPG